MSWPVIVLNAFELLACIVGFVCWIKIKDTYWRWFPVYLALIVLVEITAEYFLHVKKNLVLNNGIYQYFGLPLEFLFLYWLFYRWPLIAAAIYLACWLLDIFYLGQLSLYFESISYIIGTIMLTVLLLIFFINFSKSDAILKYQSSMMFWVCIGLMIFYVGTLPFYGLRTTLYHLDKHFFYAYWYIQFVLNYLMYTLFVVAFIWGKPN
jgi:hypothetical protein